MLLEPIYPEVAVNILIGNVGTYVPFYTA